MLKEKKKKKKKKNLEFVDLNYKFLSFYLKANTATVSPPLSSVLGNFGLNTKKFCDEFNNLTSSLNSLFLLKVFVKIDIVLKTWVLKLGNIPVTYLFRLISLKKKIQLFGLGGFFFKDFFYVTLYHFFLVILFVDNLINKFTIRKNLSIIKSMNMLIIDVENIWIK